MEKTEAVTTLCRNIVTNVKPIALRHLDGQLTSAWSGLRVQFYHLGKWVIDHHEPLKRANTKEDVISLNNYSNLKPMWWKANRDKWDTWPDDTP